jgi:prolipoprotein diacylglyceryl transferase
MLLNYIPWNVDPEIFSIGSIHVRWYGLMWGLGFIFAYEIVSRLFKKEGYPDYWADKLFVYCIVSSVIGARLGHCLFYEWDYYGAHPLEILKIWKGGLASHGGVFALILALVWSYHECSNKNSFSTWNFHCTRCYRKWWWCYRVLL